MMIYCNLQHHSYLGKRKYPFRSFFLKAFDPGDTQPLSVPQPDYANIQRC